MPGDAGGVGQPGDGPIRHEARALIVAQDLTIVDSAERPVLDGVSLRFEPGERVGIVGESGSGKTTLALATLGALRRGLRVSSGRILVSGMDTMALRGSQLRSLRGRTVAYLPQDPASSLTPTLRLHRQIAELAADRSMEAICRRLAAVGLPSDRQFRRRYPHQLSGGQQQRLAFARTTASQPRALILDEPTTGLDSIVQNLVLDQIDELVRSRRLLLLLITHDLGAAARITDRLVVLRAGKVVEDGPVTDILERPGRPYTRELVEAATSMGGSRRRPGIPPLASASNALVEVRDLTATHAQGRHLSTVVSGVSFSIDRGECVALLGRSGSGKTTIARCLSGAHRRDSGALLLDGQEIPPRARDRSVDQRRRIQVVPQDAAGSLNPRRTVGAAILRPLQRLRELDRPTAEVERARLLSLVGLAAEVANRYPEQLSGGERQRIAIARALAAGPELLVCDEMTSSLDGRVQAAILELVAGLRLELGLTVLLITHDIEVMARMADRVLVLHGGSVCEEGPVDDVLRRPQHHCTRALVEAAARAPIVPRKTDDASVSPRNASAGRA